MCKVCVSCNGLMNYDPYFEAEVCGKCGRMERKPSEEISERVSGSPDGIDILKRIMGVMMVR